MESAKLNSDALMVERQKVLNAGKLHFVHWLVVCFSVVLTFGAWYISKGQLDEKIEAQFLREAGNVIELVSERLEKYEDGLRSGVAAIQAEDGRMSMQNWRKFANSLNIEKKYPGINGIGVIFHVAPDQRDSFLKMHRQYRPSFRMYPPHDKNEFWPITYIEPESINFAAIGLDMAHESNRHLAAQKARDTGLPQITGPIVLVQDEGKSPGFLFYSPYYEGGMPESLEGRRKNIIGLVYAPFVVKNLMAGTLEKARRHVGLRIVDDEEVLYDEHQPGEIDYDPQPLFTKQYKVDLYGRTWAFDIRTNKSFRDATSHSQPLIILFGGLFIDTLLFALFVVLSRSNRRAIDLADRMTSELQNRTKELEESNMELEKFAYITSHDLKTPLRGIGDLKEYLEEDLEPYLSSEDANPDVRMNLDRLDKQINRMDGLIKGILEYSSVGSNTGRIENVNLDSLITDIARDIGIESEKIDYDGEIKEFETDAVQFDQVMTNLISNAVKYHHDQEHARIRVTSSANGHSYHFTVSDNGPGIDPKFHSRIFEVFQTLHSKDDIDSTGIGLSIVKKTIEGHNGNITVDSEVGKGASFTFSWPKKMN